ncbi:MAG TPA: GGDEF domain-containing protein [Steroidobacteraceae bacterium]|jgi:diguanylate cyclase (GGDEF)-like protein|nr:GGDEF domain-containing protein [Steroidobacteraceae bacterium]
MALPERVKLEDFPLSPYARELREGVARLRFAARLEEIFRQAHLVHMRLRVRLWICVIAAIALVDILCRATGAGEGLSTPRWAAITADASALLLAALVWSHQYTRLYLPVARVLMPLSAGAIAVLVAHRMLEGEGAQLAVLTINILAIFFFTGLLFRAALVASLTLLAAYVATLLAAGAAHSVLLPSLVVVLLMLLLCIVGYRDIEHAYRRDFLETALVAELVARDELSGLATRPAFDQHLAQLWPQAQRTGRTLAVLMVDVDQFKAYNDSYGHLAGDAALRAVAQMLKSFARRPLDLAGRYGGDEFIAVLYDLPAERVQEIAERLRQGVQEGAHSGDLPDTATLTVSIGAAVVVPGEGRSMQGAVQLADEALYEAKQAGRNRVILKGMDEYRKLQTGSFRATATASASASA